MKYNIITYRLRHSAKPADILQAIEHLMQSKVLHYQSCLFKASVSIVEYEFEGKLHSNRAKNAILSICQKHLTVMPFFQHIKKDKGEDHMDEVLSISNFSEIDYTQKGTIDDSTIREIVAKIPRPYNTNDLELIFDGVHFATGNDEGEHMKPPKSGLGPPTGNYILYERYANGTEKHSYMYFSANDMMLDDMRSFFFEFAKKIPGKYEGTEIQTI